MCKQHLSWFQTSCSLGQIFVPQCLTVLNWSSAPSCVKIPKMLGFCGCWFPKKKKKIIKILPLIFRGDFFWMFPWLYFFPFYLTFLTSYHDFHFVYKDVNAKIKFWVWASNFNHECFEAARSQFERQNIICLCNFVYITVVLTKNGTSKL